ncbi:MULTISPECIES: hypothetical protein [Microbacterium]|uniref:hypothetical protein n=1 Tax=Microbacterium TaxID=33882 RepID=UPI000CFD30BF|nr:MULTISPECIES: hypothetical protein [unclassified Microbacterium]PRB10723.1 hypothetical protein CQ047_06350 [Microbacterium sp. MYb72]
MESKSDDPTPEQALGQLADAEASRTALANRLVLPPFLLLALGSAIAVQIASTAVVWTSRGYWFTIAGALLYVAVALLQLRRFRRVNGVTVGGFASRVVGGTATEATMSYLLALAGAMWAGFAGVWWLVPVCALAGGVGFALSGARWVRMYRADPAEHARGESVAFLLVLGVLAACGIALLFLNH